MLILQYWNTMTAAHPNPLSLKPKFSNAKFAAEPQANAAKSAGNLCAIRSIAGVLSRYRLAMLFVMGLSAMRQLKTPHRQTTQRGFTLPIAPLAITTRRIVRRVARPWGTIILMRSITRSTMALCVLRAKILAMIRKSR